MRKIRLGIIGAGAIARKHLEVLRAISRVEVVGITSRTRAKAERLAAEFGVQSCFDDVDSLVRKARPEALVVLVSVDQMFKVASEVITPGLPLFIEKPAGMNPEENRQLANLARRKSVLTMVGFNRRYYSIFRKGMEIIRKYGPLLGVAVEGHERMWLRAEQLPPPVRENWIFVNSVHTIDLLRFFGGEVKNIQSVAGSYKESKGDQFGAVLRFDSGAIGQYSSHWYSPGGWRVVLYGDGVTVKYEPLEEGVWVDKNFKSHPLKPDQEDVDFKPGFFRQMEAFCDLVRSSKRSWPLQDLEGSYRTMLLAEEMRCGLKDES